MKTIKYILSLSVYESTPLLCILCVVSVLAISLMLCVKKQNKAEELKYYKPRYKFPEDEMIDKSSKGFWIFVIGSLVFYFGIYRIFMA